MKHYLEVETIYQKISQLKNAISILSWDIAVNIAPASIDDRANQLACLKNIIHEIITGNKLRDLLSQVDQTLLNQWQKKNLSLIMKEQNQALAYDEELIHRFAKATTISEMKWRVARAENDFFSFLPYLEEVVKLTKEMAKCKAEKLGLGLYDALIDDYEPNMNQSTIDPIFKKLEFFLKDFIPQVIVRQQSWQVIENKMPINNDIQFALAKKLMLQLNFDFQRGRIDLSTHPQCIGNSDDVRITTRFDQQDLISGIMGVVHETGHAIYVQNLPSVMKYQAVASAIGMAMHESQSLVIEMQMARSREFLSYLSHLIKETTNIDHACFSADNLYKQNNLVTPSLIRVDADEVTYPAHIIMRYKIEKMIIEDNLPLKDLPKIWAEESKKILGIVPKTDSEGVLQDIHWSCGLFGYFPCYSLGAIMAAQFFKSASEQNKSLMQNIQNGELSKLTNWLNSNIHNKGLLYYSDKLLEQVTGSSLDLDCYTTYLQDKFLSFS